MATKVQQINTAAKDLVARSRLGDQNAIAMIIMIRQSAKAGSKRAIYTLKYLTDYVKKHPIRVDCKIGFGCDPATQRVINSMHSRMGADPASAANTVVRAVPKISEPVLAAPTLANTGNLLGKIENNPRINEICQYFDEDQLDAFQFGCTFCYEDTDSMHADMSEKVHKALHIGKAIGIARRIQAARKPGTSIAVISKM